MSSKTKTVNIHRTSHKTRDKYQRGVSLIMSFANLVVEFLSNPVPKSKLNIDQCILIKTHYSLLWVLDMNESLH